MSKGKAAQEAATPVEKTKKKGDLMYLGPTIVGAARRGTVFKGGVLPKKAQECIAEFPQMERLFVEVDQMAEAVRELRKNQSALGVIYSQTAQKFMRRV